jgi:hypothetical protein
MSSYPRVFDPLDLEIIDRTYEAACVRFEAQIPRRGLGPYNRSTNRKLAATKQLHFWRSNSSWSRRTWDASSIPGKRPGCSGPLFSRVTRKVARFDACSKVGNAPGPSQLD